LYIQPKLHSQPQRFTQDGIDQLGYENININILVAY